MSPGAWSASCLSLSDRNKVQHAPIDVYCLNEYMNVPLGSEMGHVNILPLKPLACSFPGGLPQGILSASEPTGVSPPHNKKSCNRILPEVGGVEGPVPRSPILGKHQDASSQFRAVVCPGPIIFEFVLCQEFWVRLHCLQDLWLLHIQGGFLLEARPWRRGAHRRQREGLSEAAYPAVASLSQ